MINQNLKNDELFTTNYQLQTNSGVALFVAVMTASIALVIGIGALNISLKEIKLSSLGGESSVAFYAADTGLECALYWDLDSAGSIFATSSASAPAGNSDCIGEDITSGWAIVSDAGAATTTFTLKFNTDDDPCTNVTVAKYKDFIGRAITKVDSRGLNSCNPASAKRVERGVRVTY